MSRLRWEANQAQLLRRFEVYAATNEIARPGQPSDAVRLGQSMYLAHSTASAKFSEMCAAGRLLSAIQLAPGKGVDLSPDSVKVLLGTADFVFFYVAPFSFLNTGCGLLFARTLEEYHRDDGVATPFDSGGLVNRVTRPDPAEPPHEFLARHELPVPDHREYLGVCLGTLFDSPMDYLQGSNPRWPGPIGLTGGDRRRWTHEVRIPREVFIRTGHLQAVFAPKSRVAADPEIGRLFEWCKSEGVDRIPFNASRGDDFDTLRRVSVDYIRGKLQ
ncbi:MAG: hypothetical protein NT090_12165 [Acidobacteria bacterium]|nr:hypothetical protein [Acidobacteriota bacterium]